MPPMPSRAGYTESLVDAVCVTRNGTVQAALSFPAGPSFAGASPDFPFSRTGGVPVAEPS